MRAIILSIGDELVLGQTVDTNSAWLSQQLAAVGCDTVAHFTVADDQQAIESAIKHAASRCDVLLVNGGLGPTADDLTRQAVAAVIEQPLELNPQWLAKMEDSFRSRGRPMPEANKIQAMIPRGARMIWNHNGTAAGIHATHRSSADHVCQIFVMPGVPKEMKLMFERDIAGQVSAEEAGDTGPVILSRTLHTFGLGESVVAQMLGGLMDRKRNPSVGTTVSAGIVSLRLNARFIGRAAAGRELDQTTDLCRQALGDLIYGQDEQTLASVVGNLLKEKGLTLATAESCTAGLLAKLLTDIGGSSQYFQRGWITYSNEAKTQMLDVPAELLEAQGAVSEVIVKAMADSARRKSQAAFALAISGIAGPAGGTAQKPVGSVCIGLASLEKVSARSFVFPGDREMIRDRAAKMALALLRFELLGILAPY
jgi:nicotinamide-nucleotide amidase